MECFPFSDLRILSLYIYIDIYQINTEEKTKVFLCLSDISCSIIDIEHSAHRCYYYKHEYIDIYIYIGK